MTDVLGTVIIVAALLTAAYALVATLRNRAMDLGQLIALGVLEALLVAQVVVGFVKLSGGGGRTRPRPSPPTCSACCSSRPRAPAGGCWSAPGGVRRDRHRGVAVAVMVVRMNQLWSGTGV